MARSARRVGKCGPEFRGPRLILVPASMAAQDLALRQVAAAESQSEHLLRGRSIGGGSRTLAALPPYLIRFRVTGEIVEIITIRHGARR